MRQSSVYVRQSTRGCHETDLAGLWYWQRKSKRSSGTGTLLSFGSIVQKGKFSAAAWLLVSTLKKVDFLQRTASGKPLMMIHNTYFVNIHIICNTHIPDVGQSHNSNFQRGSKSPNQRRLFRCFYFFGRHLHELQVC